MKRVFLSAFLIFLIVTAFLFFSGSQASALTKTFKHDNTIVTATVSPDPITTETEIVTINLVANTDFFLVGEIYEYEIRSFNNNRTFKGISKTKSKRNLIYKIRTNGARGEVGSWGFVAWLGGDGRERTPENTIAELNYSIFPKGFVEPRLEVDGRIQINKPVIVTISNLVAGQNYTLWYDGDVKSRDRFKYSGGHPDNKMTRALPAVDTPSERTICLELGSYWDLAGVTCRYSVDVEFIQGVPDSPTSVSSDSAADGGNFYPPFDPLEESRRVCGDRKISTGLGCIPVDNTNAFIAWFLRWALGIAGGVAFLLIVTAGFMVMTASGNPERAQAGRELLTAAVSGLIIIIFSVFLLKLIGVDILELPGLAK